ncbi:hypothetical protein ACX0GZ_04305 [Sphingomonas aestuarii]
MTQNSNVRAAPREVSPLLITRLLGIFEKVAADEGRGPRLPKPATPRIRIGGNEPKPRNVVKLATPLQGSAAALAFLRANGVSVSVAESSNHGTTRWWVSGHFDPLDAAALIELARAKGFAA